MTSVRGGLACSVCKTCTLGELAELVSGRLQLVDNAGRTAQSSRSKGQKQRARKVEKQLLLGKWADDDDLKDFLQLSIVSMTDKVKELQARKAELTKRLAAL